MFNSIKLRVALTLVVLLVAVFFLLPTILPGDSPWQKMLPAEKIHLGLDLQGGTHLVLEVDTEKAVDGWLFRMGNDIRENLMDKGILFRYLEQQSSGNALVFELPDAPSRTA
ncbi:MAG: protein translocase subunit SecD, partial [Deltaproteobacteria bacterium]|nr:protein translocase subunit SecD [Deltaproteobacteria bacterium]